MKFYYMVQITAKKILIGVFIIIFIFTLVPCDAGSISCMDVKKQVNLPVITYHNIDNKDKNKATISIEELEDDLKYIKKEGYTTITSDELLNYERKGLPLPAKPIMLTFDNCYYSCIKNVKPLLEKFNMKAIVSVTGSFSDQYTKNPCSDCSYAHLTWGNVKELYDSNLIEFANQTYSGKCNRKNYCKGNNNCDIDKNQQKQLSDDIKKLQKLFKKNIGENAKIFTYSYKKDEYSKDTLKDLGFEVVLTCNRGINKLYGEKDELLELNRFNRCKNYTISKILYENI